ncbi:MAG TPA: UvrD-helicase domain-containing protein [Lacipirellulaceae bacterium]|jgi:ATP-dependent helicase/nuclease subunit A
MPPTTLTPEQTRALKTRDTSVALAAGAGCGKTHVLTERFLSHLNPASADAPNPAELHQLVAITFTDAAAREMRRRIRSTCRDRMQQAASTKEQDYWLQMLRAIETARVSTIHAFCTSLLRRHAITAGLEPTFGVLDQGAADVLESQVIDDVLRDQLAKRDDDTLELAASFGLSKLKSQIRELVEHRYDPHFVEWLDKSADDAIAAWQRCFDREAYPAAVARLAQAPQMRVICELLTSVTPPVSKAKFVQAKMELLDRLPRLDDLTATPQGLSDLRQYVGVQSICAAKDWPGAEQYEEYKTACKAFRDELDKCLKLQFDADAAREAAQLGLALLRLTDRVALQYDARKSAQNKLDYDDLLARAFRLVKDPAQSALRDGLSQDLQLLLVDEFQDTDQLQVDLVKLLCGERIEDGKLFFVGDFKQSIYRFRGAQPQVFHDLRSEVPERGQLPLNENFRSQPAILNFINALFCIAFHNQYEPLRPHRAQVTPEPAVEFLWAITPTKNEKSIKGAARAARAEEARRIARRIRQLIDSQATIIADSAGKNGTRPLELRDVAILFRTLSNVDLYETALRDYGLDYYVVGGHAFYAQQEIYDVLNLLRAIASPADEIALAGALRSPFFSLEDETLYWLVEAGGSLNEGLFAAQPPAELSTDERIKVVAAAESLHLLRDRKDLLPIASLLGEALAHTGYDAALLAEFLGDRKLANLHKLLEQARTADRGGVLDLAGFIAQLSEFVAREPKEPLAATLSESAHVIRLMTIHHAKGLEFPLVIVPDLDRPENDRTPPAAFSSTLGPLVPLPDDDDRDRVVTGMKLYQQLERQEDLEERKRLLYVATTRAADHLILSSSLASYDELRSDWMEALAKQFNLESGALVGQVPPGYATPQVWATDKDPTTDFKPSAHSRGPDLPQLLADAHNLAASGGGLVPREVFPLPIDVAARRQFSVSRLTGQIIHDDARASYLARSKSEESPNAVDPRELGRLVHAILERISPGDKNPIAAWCEQLAAERVVTNEKQAANLARQMVERFANSPRWSQLAAATAVHREIEFLLAWPPDRVNGDGRFLQGYIDCLYQDDDGEWHLIDYKTNDISAAACADAANRYEMQMVVYALAVERALGRPPAEIVIHFLRPGVEYNFAWDDAARRRGMALVNEALKGADYLNSEG